MRTLVPILVMFICVAVLVTPTAAQSLPARAAAQQSRLVVFESFMRLG
jgi:hypothetical protein